MTARLLLIEDHPIVRDALASTFDDCDPPRWRTASVGGLAEGMARLDAGDIDLVLLDLALPDSDGLEALTALRRAHPGVPVAVLSGVADRRVMLACLEAGAVGFVPKSASREVLLAALRLMADGGTYVPPEAVMAIDAGPGIGAAGGPGGPGAVVGAAAALSFAAANFAGGPPMALRGPARPAGIHGRGGAYPGATGSAGALAAESPSGGMPPDLGLTARQLDVLRLILDGLPNKLICRQLQLAEGTVKVHVSAVLRALGVRSRTQAVVAAGRLGLRPGDLTGRARRV